MSNTITAESETTVEPVVEQEFDTGGILTIVGGHFVHDTFTAFLPTLLPLLIEKLALSLTQASTLQIFSQIPSFFNLFLGILADHMNLRYFVIFAPAVSATLMSMLGLAPSYAGLAILLFAAGVSISSFHVPAPAMIGQISGRRVGRGMSLFMAGGEMGRTVGPLLVVWGLGQWGLDGVWRLALLGWAASAILYWRLHRVSARSEHKSGSLRSALPYFRHLFLPLSAMMLMSNFLVTSLALFLVVLLTGAYGYNFTLEQASLALAIYQGAGVAGALTGGTISDRIGRKRTMALALASASVLLILFLSASGWLMIAILVPLGFTTLSVTPVIQAIVQEQMPRHRATGNGMFMLLAFVLRSITTLIIGILGDAIGLHTAFVLCGIFAMIAVPLVFLIPDLQNVKREESAA